MKDRELASFEPGADLFGRYKCVVDVIPVEREFEIAQLMADPDEAARWFVRRVFELFNWDNPDENMMQQWQEKLISRRL